MSEAVSAAEGKRNIEALARLVCAEMGQNPDALVSAGEPSVVKTPDGTRYQHPEDTKPIWEDHARYIDRVLRLKAQLDDAATESDEPKTEADAPVEAEAAQKPAARAKKPAKAA